VILVIVFGSAFIDFINTYKSAKAAEALQEQVTITAGVIRNSELKERNMREVVPGDIIVLEAGDLVPADAILFEARDLFLNESMLTGESLPAEKTPDKPNEKMLYLGTSVVSGKGMAVAVVTGTRTKVGSIAGKLKHPDTPTEFEKNLKDFSLFIFRMTLFLVLIVILLNIFIVKHDPLQVFIFAVAIAVGLLTVRGEEVSPARAHVARHMLRHDRDRIRLFIQRGEQLFVRDLLHRPFGELLVIPEQRH